MVKGSSYGKSGFSDCRGGKQSVQVDELAEPSWASEGLYVQTAPSSLIESLWFVLLLFHCFFYTSVVWASVHVSGFQLSPLILNKI